MYSSGADGSDNLLALGMVAVPVSATSFLFALLSGDREQSRVGMAVGFAALLVAVVFLRGHRMYRVQQLALGQALAASRGASIAASLLLVLGALGLGLSLGAAVLSRLHVGTYSSSDVAPVAEIAGALALAGCVVWPGKRIQALFLVPHAVAWAGLMIVATILGRGHFDLRALVTVGVGIAFLLGGCYSSWRVGQL